MALTFLSALFSFEVWCVSWIILQTHSPGSKKKEKENEINSLVVLLILIWIVCCVWVVRVPEAWAD